MATHSHTQTDTPRQPHELTAFFEFFGCTIAGAFILHSVLRMIVPVAFFDHHSRTFGALAFLICGGFLASVFNYFARRWKKWPFE